LIGVTKQTWTSNWILMTMLMVTWIIV